MIKIPKFTGLDALITRFPNGEAKIATLPVDRYANTVVWKWETDADLFELYLFKRHNPWLKNLYIMYMPYSRMDRDGQGGTICSLRYVGEFIESLGWEAIVVLDPHSESTLDFLGEKAVSVTAFVALKESYPETLENSVVMFPDAGAQKRYGHEEIFKDMPQMVGIKERDFETGKIISYTLVNGEVCRLKNVLIVDDLCSYGGTFIKASEEIAKFDPLSIKLWVTHCEDSIWKGKLLTDECPINRVITTNSLLTKETETEIGALKLSVITLF